MFYQSLKIEDERFYNLKIMARTKKLKVKTYKGQLKWVSKLSTRDLYFIRPTDLVYNPRLPKFQLVHETDFIMTNILTRFHHDKHSHQLSSPFGN